MSSRSDVGKRWGGSTVAWGLNTKQESGWHSQESELSKFLVVESVLWAHIGQIIMM